MEPLIWLQNYLVEETHKFDSADIATNILCISNLDNPGWSVEVNLDILQLLDKEFHPLIFERSDVDWLFFLKQERYLKIPCGPQNLGEAILSFKNWLEGIPLGEPMRTGFYTMWLEDYYLYNCDGDWEHSYGFTIQADLVQGWTVIIELKETELEDVTYYQDDQSGPTEENFICTLENGIFEAKGGLRSLQKILDAFIRIAKKTGYANQERIQDLSLKIA